MDAESLRAYAMERLHYDPTTGAFTWRRTGKPAGGYKASPGRKGDGYKRIRLGDRKYRTARLAYLICFGEWPPVTVDHRNRVRDDDRLSNLRPATYAENNANRACTKNSV